VRDDKETRERENTMTRELIILKIFWGNKCVGDDKEDNELQQQFIFWTVCLFSARQPPPPVTPQWAKAFSFTRFLDHTQRRTTGGRTPLDE